MIEEERLSRDTFCLKPCGWKPVSLFSDPERETCSPWGSLGPDCFRLCHPRRPGGGTEL